MRLSNDNAELARTPTLVVSSGVKSLLDVSATASDGVSTRADTGGPPRAA